MATIPKPSKGTVADAAEKLNAAVQDFVTHADDTDDVVDKAQRRQIIDAAHTVLNAVEMHHDMWRDMSMKMAQYSAAQLFYEWKAFDLIPLEGSISYPELAAATETEEALMRRVGAVLVSTGLLKQTGPDDIACTYRSLGYREDNPANYSFNMSWQQGFVPLSRYPEYFESYGRKEPQAINHVPITFAAGKPDMGYFDMLSSNPTRLNRFMKAMASTSSSIPIAGIYDFSWLVDTVKENPNLDRAVLVDVGGGMGHAIKAIHGEFPQLPLGRFVLQDTPDTVEAGKALNEPELAQIQRLAINFHKEPPVRGAYTYWLRWCLHDYGDEICKNILRLVASAMAEDSRLLIQEHILENPRSPMNALSDFMVLAVGGKERTLDMWQQLIGAAGLRISHIARAKEPFKTYPCSVIECVKN